MSNEKGVEILLGTMIVVCLVVMVYSFGIYITGRTIVGGIVYGFDTEGLLLHYKFEDSPIDQGPVADESVWGNKGKVFGQINSVESFDGDAFSFNGDPDIKVRTPILDLRDYNYGTWSLWFKTDGLWDTDNSDGGYSGRGTTVLIDTHELSSNLYGMGIYLTPDNGNVIVDIHHGDGRADILYGEDNLLDNQWHHVAMVYGRSVGNELSLYVDGQKIASKTLLIAWTFKDHHTYIGDSYDNWEEFEGEIDEVRIYNISLSSSEVQQLYNEFKDDLPAPEEEEEETEEDQELEDVVEQLTAQQECENVGGALCGDEEICEGEVVALTGEGIFDDAGACCKGQCLTEEEGGEKTLILKAKDFYLAIGIIALLLGVAAFLFLRQQHREQNVLKLKA